jgi:hypothetical protein
VPIIGRDVAAVVGGLLVATGAASLLASWLIIPPHRPGGPAAAATPRGPVRPSAPQRPDVRVTAARAVAPAVPPAPAPGSPSGYQYRARHPAADTGPAGLPGWAMRGPGPWVSWPADDHRRGETAASAEHILPRADIRARRLRPKTDSRTATPPSVAGAGIGAGPQMPGPDRGRHPRHTLGRIHGCLTPTRQRDRLTVLFVVRRG